MEIEGDQHLEEPLRLPVPISHSIPREGSEVVTRISSRPQQDYSPGAKSKNPQRHSSRTSYPIKVLHIINDLSVGGAEMMLCKLLSEVNRERFAPTVISLRNRGRVREKIEALGVPVHSFAMRLAVPTPTSLYRLARLVRKLEPDLIQGWLAHGNLAAQLVSAFIPKSPRVLWSIRQSLYSFSYEKKTTAWAIKLGSYLSKMPVRILYNSRTSAAQHAAIGYSSDKALVIPNGFDLDVFAPSEEARRSVRLELGVDPSTILVGLTARYHPVKDHANFLYAAALLHKKHPNVQFVLLGKEVTWNNSHLRELIHRLELVERIHLLGERPDIQRITPSLDIAVSSSCMEGFPNVVGEAMSCGVPCVVTDISDLPWIVDGTGYVVPPKNPEALAHALAKLINLGPEARKSRGLAARRRVMEHFCLSSVARCYEEVYESVLFSKSEAEVKMVSSYRDLTSLRLTSTVSSKQG